MKLLMLLTVASVGAVREGVVLKVRRNVHEMLVKVTGEYMRRYGRRVTYSDVIEALLKATPDPVEVLRRTVGGEGDG